MRFTTNGGTVQDSNLQIENYDIFWVRQLTRDTKLEHLVACDFVRVLPQESSEIHRHNNAETVLYIVEGQGEVYHNGTWLKVKAGDRIRIGKGVFHGVRTGNDSLFFISVQSPPILDKASGKLDLEPFRKTKTGG